MADRKTILIIDDDSDIHFFCRGVLEAAGYRVITADNGEHGLAAAETEEPDLILLDIMMERINTGYSVAQQLGRVYPVILMSSMLNESDLSFDPDTVPFRDVLVKPLDAESLLNKVRALA